MYSGKRSACDRCRDQKLRCRRENGVTCVRCVRAGATCITSTAKPMGRPLRKPLYDHTEHSHSWMPTPQKTLDNQYSEMTPDTNQQNVFLSVTSPKIDMLQTGPDSTMHFQPQSWDPMMPNMPADSFSTTMDDLFSFLGPPPCGSNGDDLLQGFLDQSTASCTPENYPLTPRDSTQQSPGKEYSAPSSESAYHKDPLLALSKLNHFLIECHFILQNQACPPPWRVSMVDSNLARESKLEKNPVGTLLRSTAEYIDIVRTWTKTMSDQTTDCEKRKDSLNFYHFQPGTYTLNKPTILIMITTYILFVRMFDVLFSRLIVALQEFPNEVAKVSFEPGFKLAGFSLPQGLLYLKIIVQTFEHQLERIESSLGLPVEYRVYLSERQHDSSGVFGHAKYQSLLKAVMTEALEEDDWDDENAEPDNQGEVFRLRKKVTKMKELLQRL